MASCSGQLISSFGAESPPEMRAKQLKPVIGDGACESHEDLHPDHCLVQEAVIQEDVDLSCLEVAWQLVLEVVRACVQVSYRVELAGLAVREMHDSWELTVKTLSAESLVIAT